MKKIISITLTICLIATGIYLYDKYRIPPKIAFANLQLTDLEGNPVTLPANKKMVVNFWATWCGPCVAEMPALQSMQQKLGDEFAVVCISDEPLDRLNSFKTSTAYTLTILRSVNKLAQFDVHTLPTTYIINAKGEIVHKQTGKENWDSDEMIEKLKKKAE